MIGLEALRVRNLRCLSDTGQIPIRPITILVGRNSSGKSTFLRVFPLLRQSVETATASPILWNRPRYVDFGALANAINHRATSRSVTFEFSVRLPENAYITLETPPPRIDVAMTLAEGQTPHSSYIAWYEIRCLDHVARLQFTPLENLLRFEVDGTDVMPSDIEMCLDGVAHLLPTIHAGHHGKVKYQAVPRSLQLDPPTRLELPSEPLLDVLAQSLRPLYFGQTKESSLAEIANDLPLGSEAAMWQKLEATRKMKKESRLEGPSGPTFQALIKRVFARLVPWILDATDLYVADFMSRVAYLGPLRATADRVYPVQDLAVDDVDPDGKNLAMFLHSLSQSERESFAAFTREHMGFESKIEVSGHSSLYGEILVKEPEADRHINLVDIGFGYTEVLPLMAILWSTCCRARSAEERPASLIAIEQPELHLHPAHQVALASVIASAFRASRDAGRQVNIMVETHSEGIVNGLGDLIERGVLRADEVQLVVFDQDAQTRETSVRIAGFTDDGALNDAWPFGFFAPVRDR